MSAPVFYDWPNGMKSVAGGTRGEIKLSRPWQQEIVVNPETCPFCTGKGQALEELESGEWLLLQNRFTPYPFHRMVIPRTCWTPDELRVLGGKDRLKTAFSCIQKEIDKNAEKKLFVNVHIGALAGQNVGHLHWHIVEYMLGDISVSRAPVKIRDFFRTRDDLILWSSNSVIVGIGGLKAGQCFIFPNRYPVLAAATLVEPASWLVQLCNDKFKSTQGLRPDFSLAFQFSGGAFQYGIYTPVLNHWGGAEQMALYEPGCPITLPWPHELTAEYLKS